MKKYFDTYKISFIDTFAINDYFLSGLELYKRNLKGDSHKYQYIRTIRDVRRGYMAEMIAKDGYKKASQNIKKVFFDNLTGYPIETFGQFKNLIIENSIQSSSFFISENKKINIIFNNVTLSQNRFILIINIVSVLFFITKILSVFILNKKYILDDYIMCSLLLFFCIHFTYLSTGVTFWQGDRILVPIYYASIILFIYQIEMIFQVIRNTRQISSIVQGNNFENERAIS